MFQKFLSLVITFFLTGLICLIHSLVMAGSSTDYIRDKCPKEFNLHKATVTEFAIRMKPNVEQCGCGVVNLYYALNKGNMELIAQLEEDSGLMKSAARVFGISEHLTESLRNAPEVVPTLTILAEHDPLFFQKLSDALTSFSGRDRKQLDRNPSYILYYLLSAAMTDDDAQRAEIVSMVKRLKKKVAPEAIDVFSLLYAQTFDVYPHGDPDFRCSVADVTLRRLGLDTVRAIRPYKAHLALFLPPTEKEIPESQNLDNAKYEQLKENYTSLLIHVFQQISERYGLPYGLKVVEHLAQPLMEALRFHQNKH